MTKRELLASAEDQIMSDEQVFENLKVYVTQYDGVSVFTKEEQEEYEEVSEMLYRLRPEVMEMFRIFVVEQHKGCCCGPE